MTEQTGIRVQAAAGEEEGPIPAGHGRAAAVLAGLVGFLLLSLAGWVLWAKWGFAVWLSGFGRFCL